MRNHTLAFLLIFCLLAIASASDQPDSWTGLKEVTHRASFVVVRRDRRCDLGDIKNVTDSAITIGLPDAPQKTIERKEVFRVTAGATGASVIYSARSSWFDVEGLTGHRWVANVNVLKKSDGQITGKLTHVSADAVSLEVSGKNAQIAKRDISKIYYLRQKPLSASAQYADQELVFMKIFDPELWPYMFHLEGSIPILIYDSSLPEDNSPVICNKDPWRADSRAPDGPVDVTRR